MTPEKISQLGDAEVISLARNQSETAKNVLIQRYVPLVKSLCQIQASDAFKEDLEQELWMCLWELALQYDASKAKFSTMAYRFLKAKRKEILQKEKRRLEGTADFELSMAVPSNTDVISDFCAKQDLEQALRFIKFTPRQIWILALMEAGYQSSTELGKVLEISQQSAYRQVLAIRKKLKKFFEKQGVKKA